MKFASFKYDYSGNLGDQVQTIAAEQFLPTVDKKFNRDDLVNVSENDKYMLIMNGWFSHFPDKCFPPSDSILPVFFGFHLTNWYGDSVANHFLGSGPVEYMKKHGPIGCRDKHTMQLLRGMGIDSFYSKCLTLTFPERTHTPESGHVFLVDTDNIPIPASHSTGAIKITHAVNDIYNDQIKTMMAKTLLSAYRNHARLVITTKLHCALPCIAMGIPVIFFGDPDDYRISILGDLNVPIYKHLNNVDWNPGRIPIQEEKRKLIDKINEMTAAKGLHH